MNFHSLEYLLFLPAIAVLYYATPHPQRWLVLLGGSYLFYAAWRVEFLPLLIFSTVTDYLVALALDKESRIGRRKLLLSISVTVNIGLLVAFKYLAAGWSLVGEPLYRAGWIDHFTPLQIVLPLGISFYSFQTLSYSIDVYRRKLQPERHFGYFATYVTFFPQLLAGPIERAGQLLPQFRQHQHFDLELAVSGGGMMLLGYFKKLVIADRLGMFTDLTTMHPLLYRQWEVLLTSPALMYRYYCDLSGYADIAIGSALIFGIRLTENFNRPFAASSFTDFWFRWHITVTKWFRDYLLIPLAGRRSGPARRYGAIILTTVLIGLWHGATGGWIMAGVLAAVAAIVEGWWRKRNRRLRRRSLVDGLPAPVRFAWSLLGPLFVIFVFLFVTGSILAFGSIAGAWSALRFVAEPQQGGTLVSALRSYDATVLVAAIVGLELWQWGDSRKLFSGWALLHSIEARWALYAGMTLLILTLGVLGRPGFLYFNF